MMHLSSNREEQLRTASLLTMPSKEDQRRHRDCAMFAIPQLHLRLRTNDYHPTNPLTTLSGPVSESNLVAQLPQISLAMWPTEAADASFPSPR